MEDVFKTAGATKASKPDAGGAVVRSVPVFGLVKNNIDPTRAGRIQVYISDLGGDDPDNPDNWATVSYMSPFYGYVEPTASESTEGNFTENPTSYGVWNSPPDLNSTVICIFINGDPNYGFYIGAAPKPEALHMVPAIGAAKLDQVKINNDKESQSYGGAEQLPVTNINMNNEGIANDDNFLDEPKPLHSYLASIMFKQGIIRDTLRGPVTTGAQRESPSRVGWGVSSPGRPIYAGGYTDASIVEAAKSGKDDQGMTVISRRGGHSIVLDDGDLVGRDQLVRIRSSAGHQILMSDDGQTIFIIHSNGQSWIEMGKEGTIDMFCTNSFNVRTQGDINLHADNNINIHAKKKLNIKAEDIYIQSEKSTSHNVGTSYKIETTGKYNLKVGDVMSIASGGVASVLSSSITYINGSKVHLNTGQGPSPDAVAPIQDIVHTDTLFDSVKGYLAAPGKLKSITSRAPAHAPWSNANQGVNVQTNSNAETALPAAPAPAAQAANNAAASAPAASPISPAGLATVPPVAGGSSSMDPQTTASTIGAVATNAASGPAASAVASGFGSVPTTEGLKTVVGPLAQSPAQLETGGLLKPGAAPLVSALVQGGTPINKSLVENVFTGQGGVNSLVGLVNNAGAQVNSMATNLQKAQTTLTNSGVLSGKEAGTSIAGMVMAGVTSGVNNTISAVKNLASGLTPKAGVAGAASSVLTAMNAGNFAAGVAQKSTGGMSSIISTVLPVAGLIAGAKMQQRGATAAAFGVIAASLGNLQQPKPTGHIMARSSGLSDPLKSAANIIKTTGQILGGNASKITNAVAGGLGAVSRLNSASNPTQQLNAITGVVSSLGGIGIATGNKSLAKTAKDINKAIGAAKTIGNSIDTVNKGLATIASATSTGQALGGVSKILGAVGKTGSVLGNKNFAKTTAALQKVVSNTNQILRASNALATSKNIDQTLGAYGNIVRAAGGIAGAFGKNSKNTGLAGIPGGQLSVGSIVNKSLGAMGIPKNPALGKVISNAVTSAINNAAYPQVAKAAGAGAASLAGAASGLTGAASGLAGAASGAAAGLAGAASGAVAALQAGAQGLAGMTLGKLPSMEAGPLSATLASVGFGGANALKIPSIGINTNDIAAVNAQINAVLDDPRIPKPDFGDVDEGAIAALESVLAQNNQVDSMFDQVDSLIPEVESAREEYYNLENSLPPGDPQIAQARDQWVELSKQLQTALDSINAVIGDEENTA